MSIEASSVQVIYVQLDKAGEWVMAAREWKGRPGVYRWRLVRMGIVLIDGGFKMRPGETIKERLAKAVEEFEASKGNYERLFHKTNREEGVRLPPYARRGVTPFNCHFSEFKALAAQWQNRVPSRLVRADFKVFRPWGEADKALRVAV